MTKKIQQLDKATNKATDKATGKTTDQRKLKGEATREKLVIEAIRLFGQNGFKATNTRALAEAANCNLGLITFHFGGKQGLYEAAIQRVKDRLMEMLTPSVKKLESLAKSDSEGEKLFQQLANEINALAIKFIGMEKIAGHSLFLLQDINENNAHSIAGYRDVFSPLIASIEVIINKATNNINPSRARLSAFMLINTTLGFLRDYPIFFPESEAGAIKQPSIDNLVELLSHHLMNEYHTYFKFKMDNDIQ